MDRLDTTQVTGLTEEEAAERLARDGPNELPSARPRGILGVIVDVVREPMLLLLIGAGGIYLVLGSPLEAVTLLAFVLVVIGISIVQEERTERALTALRDLSSPRALVVRGGVRRRIAGREVVRGDVVLLNEGDRVPADCVLEWCANLMVDESLLTGESLPVRKQPAAGPVEHVRPGGEDLPVVFAGTLVVRGQGIGRVLATGEHTEIGRIGRSLQSAEPEPTPLHRETGQLVRDLAVIGLALCALVTMVYAATRHDWLHGVLAGITLAMAILPEEFPVVLNIFLALGAWRLSHNRVLTRRITAIELLGATTVLAVDKTGTLTQNRMQVMRLATAEACCDVSRGECTPLPEALHTLAEYALLASQRDPFDPVDGAIKRFSEEALSHTEHLHADWELVREYPLTPQLLALSQVWVSPDREDYLIAAKGAPEAIADLCHLTPEQARELDEMANRMASDGLRVLGVASAAFRPGALPGQQHDFAFRFIGLVGLADPVRPDAAPAIRQCRDAGIRVVMVTGDYPGTARNVARQIGLTPADRCLTGPDIARMDDAELQQHAQDTNLFARVLPEQKLRLVRALKAGRQVVAMTGDGVNDAPALKAADIGIAMGRRGTDVARESADLVLLDDAFSSIVEGVRSGRRIFDNLRKAMAYILAVHVPIAGMSLVPVLADLPLVLLPFHIAFLELIIDPASSTVFEAEPEEPGIMTRPPRDPQERLFAPRAILLSLLQGLAVFATLLLIFGVTLYQGKGEREARTLTFTALTVANLALVHTNRSWQRTIASTLAEPNRSLWLVTLGTLILLGLVLYLPALQSLFRFAPVKGSDLLLAIGAGGLSIVWFEALKALAPAQVNGPTRQSGRYVLPAGERLAERQ